MPLHDPINNWPRHAPSPGVRSFALLGALDAGVRGTLTSVLPIELYRAFGNADTVSGIYLVVGMVSLCFGLMVPWLTSILPRRWTFTLGMVVYAFGHICGVIGGPLMALSVGCQMIGAVTFFICLNAYVMDYIARNDLGRNESLRMFYSGIAWTICPIVGVVTQEIWRPLPFLISGTFACCLLVTFWVLRLGNGKAIAKARGPSPNPISYLGRFFAQPRLIAGWTFAVVRSSGWWVFTVYLPIYAVEAGLDSRVGGFSLSASSGMLFATPLMLKWMQQRSIRTAVRTGFLGAALVFLMATGIALLGLPWGVVGLMTLGTGFLLLLDVSGGLPFLMAVKPSERTEMAAVYASFRDVSGIFTPALASVVLLAAPLSWIFAAMAVPLGGCWLLAGTLHPKLGHKRH